MSPAERILALRKRLNLTQGQFGKLAGVSKQAVSNWERGETTPDRDAIRSLRLEAGIDPDWLREGRGPVFLPGWDEGKRINGVEGENVSPGPDIRAEIPLISWVQAGAWQEVQDPLQPGEYERLIPVTRRFSKRAYALRVQGDSMQSAEGPSFPDGSVICVEPEQVARSGSFVVARLDDSMEATFKQLVIDGDRRYLKPLNPRYPIMPIDGELTICGVVRQLVMDFD